MKPRMEKRDAFRVIGVEEDAAKINGEDPGFGKLWMDQAQSAPSSYLGNL